MKSVVLFLVCATILVGCEPTRPVSSSTRTPASSVDEVTLSSHLNGANEDDPQLFAGQKIRLVPDPGEGFLIPDSLLVQLPSKTPYEGVDAQYYLRGYAVGQMYACNISLR